MEVSDVASNAMLSLEKCASQWKWNSEKYARFEVGFSEVASNVEYNLEK